MPIEYDRNDDRRLITLTLTEPHSIDDFVGAIDRQAAENTWGYATLYDLRHAIHAPSDSDLQQMAQRITAIAPGQKRGRVGIAIAARPLLFLHFLTYAQLTKEFATVEVLLTAAQLDDWLARNTRGPSRQP